VSKDSDSWKLAIADLLAVQHVAQVLQATPTGGQVALVAQGRTYDDPALPRMLETGLVVTYIRVFTEARNYTPVPDRWVPSEHRDLHEFLFDRRHRYDAHIDRRQNRHPRPVGDGGYGWFSVGYPDLLTAAQLEELVELTRKLRVTLDANL
jgi:hypothetical protein